MDFSSLPKWQGLKITVCMGLAKGTLTVLTRHTPEGLMTGHGLLELATMAGLERDGPAGGSASPLMAALRAVVVATRQ